MDCLSPLLVPVTDPSTGEYRSLRVAVPCSKCPACLHNRQMYWTMRLKDHLHYHPNACFVTLTYDESHLPEKGVSKQDLRRFHDRMRSTIAYGKFVYFRETFYGIIDETLILPPCKFKYYLGAEYGPDPSGSHRPHYHAIYFLPDDYDIWLFQCLIEHCWKNGFVTCDKVRTTGECVSYIANYILSGSLVDIPIGQNPVFQLCSKGLGLDYVEEYRQYLTDGLRQYTVRNGRRAGMPRYYRVKLFGQNYELSRDNIQRLVDKSEQFRALPDTEKFRIFEDRYRQEVTINQLDRHRLFSKGKLK